MKHPFPTTQRNPGGPNRLADNLLSPFVRWLGPEGVKRTLSTSLLEERDAETDISPSSLCHEPPWLSIEAKVFYNTFYENGENLLRYCFFPSDGNGKIS
ncbi:hypothetical protein [Melghirimyces algeriensis]|uniref:Uncharacterized protein n=1 Tax=Melghirimyces algeriensis TaxID=910412 RepID=A0A521FG61_9BACL|nr:hypothetical protein [Melghirimyces algeriensis]SMO95176.1 hypothetical protein SAMN06264849_11921 [Melghirimyces algeriensis]